MQKKQKKSENYWKKTQIAVILLNIVMCGGVCSSAELPEFDTGKVPGAAVRIESEDAERQRSGESVKRDLGEAKAQLARQDAEIKTLKATLKLRDQERAELTEKYQKQNEQYRQLRLVLSGALASENVRSTGEREEQLLRSLNGTAKGGGALALDTVEFCELTEPLLKDLPIGKVKQTELLLELEELKRSARRFIAETGLESSGEKLAKCRIFAVEPELSMVILPVGSVHGAFNGLTYYVGKDDEVVLRVVCVRPYVAAAQLVSGRIDKLSPGMEVAAQSNKESRKQ